MNSYQKALLAKFEKNPPKLKGSNAWKMYEHLKTNPVHHREKKEPKITTNAQKPYVIAEHHAQKADPHYEKADRPHLTKGSQVYERVLAKYKK